MAMHPTKTARGTGFISALLTTGLLAVYLIVLGLGLLSLSLPDQPIGNPYFVMMEVLIIMMVAIFAVSPAEKRVFAICS